MSSFQYDPFSSWTLALAKGQSCKSLRSDFFILRLESLNCRQGVTTLRQDQDDGLVTVCISIGDTEIKCWNLFQKEIFYNDCLMKA